MASVIKQRMVAHNHLVHFMYLPKILGFSINEHRGVTHIACGLGSSMFNIVYGVPHDAEVAHAVARAKEIFAGQPFAWWVPPMHVCPRLTKGFLDAGFHIEAPEYAMICDLADFVPYQARTSLMVKPVTNMGQLADFIDLLSPYDASVSHFYAPMEEGHLQGAEKLFVGYVDGVCVTIGLVCIDEKSAGIFSVLTREAFRGHGYAGDMMVALMGAAKDAGCESVTLSASSEGGYRIYERLGFEPVGSFGCFEFPGDVT